MALKTSIRHANVADAEALARCHIAAWRDTYRPLLADEYLDLLSLDNHVAGWIEKLRQPDWHTLVAQDDQRQPIGFLSGGPERTGRADYRGEIYSVYLLKACRRQGTGRRLFQRFAEELIRNQIFSLIVWALEGNECRAAYAAWGGQEVECAGIKIGQQDLVEVAYGWTELRSAATFA